MVTRLIKAKLLYAGPVNTAMGAGFSIDLNFQDVMTSKLKNLDVSVQNLEVMQ